MNYEQRTMDVLRELAGDLGNRDDDGALMMHDAEIVSRGDEMFPLAAGCVSTMHGPRIVLADTDGAVAIPTQDARKVRVRIAVGVTPNRHWYAMGHGDRTGNWPVGSMADEVRDGLSYETNEEIAMHWIEAEIPLPTDEAIRAYPLPHEGD